MSKPLILLTGAPGVGKSTVIQQMIKSLGDRAGGFYTREVRVDGIRIGFEVVTLDGKHELLATKDEKISFAREVRFESYRVNLDAMDLIAVPAIQRAVEGAKIVILDEIGPMEIFSHQFRQTITNVLARNDIPLVGTIVERPYEIADQIKMHPHVQLVNVTIENREQLAGELIRRLEELKGE